MNQKKYVKYVKLDNLVLFHIHMLILNDAPLFFTELSALQ